MVCPDVTPQKSKLDKLSQNAAGKRFRICPSAGVSDGINISDVNRRCFMALSHDTPNSCPKSISILRCWHNSYHYIPLYIPILFSAGVKLGENRINEKFQRESRTPSRGCAAWLQPVAAPCVRSHFWKHAKTLQSIAPCNSRTTGAGACICHCPSQKNMWDWIALIDERKIKSWRKG